MNEPVTFLACFPPNTYAIRNRSREATRVWLDAYLGDAATREKLWALLESEVSFRVTLEVEEG